MKESGLMISDTDRVCTPGLIPRADRRVSGLTEGGKERGD